MSRPRDQVPLPPAKGLLPVLLLVLHAQLPAKDGATPRFVDVSREAGLEFVHRNQVAEPDPAAKYLVETMGSGGGFLDFDDDGWMDIYLVNGRGSNRLYRNRGDGTFADVTGEAGVGDSSYGMGCTFGDYDNDGRVDIYVTNVGPNVLYRNQGDGAFRDVSRRSGVADPRWGTSAAFADYDGDGLLDLYLANYLEFSFQDHEPCYFRQIPIYCYPHGFDGVGNVLYRNLGGRTFIDVTRSAGLREEARYSKSLGVRWLDLDRDGDQDLYVANDTTGNYLFRNRGDGSFQDVSLESGTALGGSGMAQAGMGVAAGDLDGRRPLPRPGHQLLAPVQRPLLERGRRILQRPDHRLGALGAQLRSPGIRRQLLRCGQRRRPGPLRGQRTRPGRGRPRQSGQPVPPAEPVVPE